MLCVTKMLLHATKFIAITLEYHNIIQSWHRNRNSKYCFCVYNTLLQEMRWWYLSSSSISVCVTSPTSSSPTWQRLTSVWACSVSSPTSCPSTHPTGMLKRWVFYTPTDINICMKGLSQFHMGTWVDLNREIMITSLSTDGTPLTLSQDLSTHGFIWAYNWHTDDIKDNI